MDTEEQTLSVRHRKLLPKPPPPPPPPPPRPPAANPPAEASSSKRKTSDRACKVPVCPMVNCQLRSHREYGRPREVTIRPASDSAEILCDCLGETDRKHFNHYLHNLFPRTLLTHHAGTPEGKIDRMKQKYVELAVSNPTVVLVVISFAQLDLCKYSVGEGIDPQMDHVRQTVLDRFQSEVHDPSSFNTDDVNLMMVILLSIFDLMRNRDVEQYRAAMKQLVDPTGVHNLLCSNVYVLEHDRRLAVHTRGLPLFQDEPKEIPTVQEYFRESKTIVELFEKEKFCFEIDRPCPGTPFFFYKRALVSTAFSFLHAKIQGNDWCMLVAARLIEYPITFTGELGALTSVTTSFLRRELKDALSTAVTDWAGQELALVWVLFVLEDVFNLVNVLTVRYGRSWPTDWMAEQLHDLRQILWPNSLMAKFERTCRAIQQAHVVAPRALGE